MQDTNVWLQVLIQGGAVGISMALIWLVSRLITLHYQNFIDVVNHNTEALNKLTEKMQEKQW